jgi:hypothetical protein
MRTGHNVIGTWRALGALNCITVAKLLSAADARRLYRQAVFSVSEAAALAARASARRRGSARRFSTPAAFYETEDRHPIGNWIPDKHWEDIQNCVQWPIMRNEIENFT